MGEQRYRKLNTVLTSTLDRGEWSALHCNPFTPR